LDNRVCQRGKKKREKEKESEEKEDKTKQTKAKEKTNRIIGQGEPLGDLLS
jgi:hypothetical protein